MHNLTGRVQLPAPQPGLFNKKLRLWLEFFILTDIFSWQWGWVFVYN